jgi:DNA-binding NtrC family response regulator
LALHFLRIYGARMNNQVTGIDDDALALLKSYSWPGNIRQLENAIQHAVVIAEKAQVTIDELPAELRAVPSVFEDEPSPLDDEVREATDHWLPLSAYTPASSGIMAPPSLMSAIQNERAERERRERDRLVRALAAAGGNKAEAARALGMARTTFLSRLKRLGLT